MLERITALVWAGAFVYGGYQAAFNYAEPVIGHSLALIGFALWVGYVVQGTARCFSECTARGPHA